MNKKILLFGFTSAAIEIGFGLREKGYEFTIVDNNPEILPKAKEFGFDVKLFDYTDDNLLKKAGISLEVEQIFALFFEDAKNIFLTLSARAMDSNLNIVSITQTHDSIHKLKIAGANTVIDPYQISGKKIYEIIKKPEIVNIIDDTIFGHHNINIEEIKITKSSLLDGKYLHDVKIDGIYNIIVLGIHDKEIQDSFIFITEGLQHKLDVDDVLVAVGEPEEINRFKLAFNLP